MKQVGKIKFDFVEKANSMAYALNVANRMHKLQPDQMKDLLWTWQYPKDFDKETTQAVLKAVADPKCCNVYFKSKNFEGDPSLDKHEKWFKTDYSLSDISPELMSRLKNP